MITKEERAEFFEMYKSVYGSLLEINEIAPIPQEVLSTMLAMENLYAKK